MSAVAANSGARAAATVAQLYVGLRTPGLTRPTQQLAGFERIVLAGASGGGSRSRSPRPVTPQLTRRTKGRRTPLKARHVCSPLGLTKLCNDQQSPEVRQAAMALRRLLPRPWMPDEAFV
ncbi:fibronectin type III-like domain-contianing protein [Streptomyces sp. NPDC002172]